MEKGVANEVIRNLLSEIRRQCDRLVLDRSRLPRWIGAAKIRTGWVNDTMVVVIEDNLDGDKFDSKGLVNTDSAILLDVPDFVTRSWLGELKGQPGELGLLWVAEEAASEATHIALTPERGGVFSCRRGASHAPEVLVNFYLSLSPAELGYPLALRFLPLAIYLHADEFYNPSNFHSNWSTRLAEELQRIHDSPLGDHYSQRNQRYASYAKSHQDGVIVFGSYEEHLKLELRQVRDSLRMMNYDADLIEDLPQTPLMDLPRKVRQWAISSRFSLFVDRVPSGHLVEWPILTSMQNILALLRPRGSGSTWMIGAELNHHREIKLFEFDDHPLEVLDEAVGWAEEYAMETEVANARFYPWMRHQAQ